MERGKWPGAYCMHQLYLLLAIKCPYFKHVQVVDYVQKGCPDPVYWLVSIETLRAQNLGSVDKPLNSASS